MNLKIGNITFRVSSLEESDAFYGELLGLPKRYEWPNFVVFDLAGVRLSLEPGGKKGRKEEAPDIYLDVDDLDDAYTKLREKGVKFLNEPKEQYWGGYTATFVDPDENEFTLVQLKK